MAIGNITLASLLTILLIFLVTAVPVYVTVRLLGGNPSVLGAFLAQLIVAGAVIVAGAILPVLGGLTGIAIPILVYWWFFDINVLQAILVWLLQGIVGAILLWLAVLIFGAAALGLAGLGLF